MNFKPYAFPFFILTTAKSGEGGGGGGVYQENSQKIKEK